MPPEATALQMRSNVRADAKLEISLAEVDVPEPGEDEVLVRVEASPINPSDLGLLFGPADMTTARVGGTEDRPVVSADVPHGLLKSVAARLDQVLRALRDGSPPSEHGRISDGTPGVDQPNA